MAIVFAKMNGAGNDFILIDNRLGEVRLQPAQIVRLCDRHRGVGADGVILLTPCASGRADWAWEFYNSDGSSAEMCGNGARCFARFGAGIITARFEGQWVRVSLTDPADMRLRQKIDLSTGPAEIHSINTGVPHAVLFVEDADQAMVGTLGPEIRHHARFAPRGVNVNFVQARGPGAIRVRTYERGVEGETLACGTGLTASALIAAELRGFKLPVQVQARGGDLLEVGFERRDGQFAGVTLAGPAEFVFEGRIQV